MAHATRVAPNRRRIAQSAAAIAQRSSGAHGGRVETTVSRVYDDAAVGPEFRTILRVGKVPTLRRWLARAEATKIAPLQRFVRKLRQDLGAVEGAVREPWSNGPVEGHINRLKMLRRQMYGRGSVELLRARLLPVPLAGVP